MTMDTGASSALHPNSIVHLLRHGEVENPTGVLYGRLPDFHLSALGRQMAERAADYFSGRDITHLRCSPLERAQETMEPIADKFQLSITTDGRVIEGDNVFAGKVFSMGASALRDPRNWWHLRNPLKPSWGESYHDIVARMRAAMKDAAEAADGHQAVIVSHQLPIWMARCDVEGRRLIHDPRKRECNLASITSFTFIAGRISSVSYAEPAADLVPANAKSKKFVAGA